MKLIFLGTAACFPTPTRGVSCTALQLDDGQVWLFDCGEGSQIQLQKCKHIRGGKVTKIFITHLHGDHVFGLPGLLCTIGMGGGVDEKTRVVDIYGPLGLRKYLLTSIEMCSSAPAFKFNIHELVPLDFQYPKEWSKLNFNFEYSGEIAKIIGEVPHNRITPQIVNTDLSESKGPSVSLEMLEDKCDKNCDIKPNHYWDVISWDNSLYSVKAAVLHHRIPCFGYVIHERDQPGTLNVQKLKDIGIKPGPMYSQIKAGIPVTLENGTVINPNEFLGPTKEGRKVTILGDTKDSSEMIPICRDSDVVIHEATNENALKSQAIDHGHSTPDMAAQFAIDAKANTLCLTHVSPRYRPSAATDIEEAIKIPTGKKEENYLFAEILKNEAQAYMNQKEQNINVLVAEDFMVIPVSKS